MAKKPAKTTAAKKPAKTTKAAAAPSRSRLQGEINTLKIEVRRLQRRSPARPTVATAKTRKWSPDSDVALCSARAVAESLRLTLGVPVSHDDVLALYWLAADDADAGASILATLGAAQEHGLAGHYPAQWRPARCGDRSTILGVVLPGGEPHAITTCDHVLWSWGEPHYPAAFRGAVIDEAWAVTW